MGEFETRDMAKNIGPRLREIGVTQPMTNLRRGRPVGVHEGPEVAHRLRRGAPLERGRVAGARVEAAVEEVARQDLVLGGLAVVLGKYEGRI